MNALLKILLAGLVISFLGSLPLGTINVMATQISVHSGKYPALLFCVGVVLIEVVYVWLALKAMDKILRYPTVFRWFEWVSVIILVLLGAACFISAGPVGGFSPMLPSTPAKSFGLGVLLSATSPMHITFWFGWSAVLKERQILIAGKMKYRFYTIGIGAGSLLGFLFFIAGGSYLIGLFHGNQLWLSRIIGTILLFTGLMQSIKIIRKYETTSV